MLSLRSNLSTTVRIIVGVSLTRKSLSAGLAPEAHEVVSALAPQRLAGGAWWDDCGLGPWPAALEAGILEPRRGYRFSPENLTLPVVLGETKAERVVDLGTGSGSLLVLASVWSEARLSVGVELQPDAVKRLERTLEGYSGFEGHVVEADLREPASMDVVRGLLGGDADLVVMNPPFFPSGWGRPSKNASKRLSTHAERGDVRDFLLAAKTLAPRGRILVVYDAGRMAEAVVAAEDVGLGLEGVWWVGDQRPEKDKAPFRVWLEFGGSGLRAVSIA